MNILQLLKLLPNLQSAFLLWWGQGRGGGGGENFKNTVAGRISLEGQSWVHLLRLNKGAMYAVKINGEDRFAPGLISSQFPGKSRIVRCKAWEVGDFTAFCLTLRLPTICQAAGTIVGADRTTCVAHCSWQKVFR